MRSAPRSAPWLRVVRAALRAAEPAVTACVLRARCRRREARAYFYYNWGPRGDATAGESRLDAQPLTPPPPTPRETTVSLRGLRRMPFFQDSELYFPPPYFMATDGGLPLLRWLMTPFS